MARCFDYTCAQCGGEFHSDRSDADQIMEYQENFPEELRAAEPDLPAVVCDDCYKAMLAELSPEQALRNLQEEKRRR